MVSRAALGSRAFQPLSPRPGSVFRLCLGITSANNARRTEERDRGPGGDGGGTVKEWESVKGSAARTFLPRFGRCIRNAAGAEGEGKRKREIGVGGSRRAAGGPYFVAARCDDQENECP